MPAGVPRLTAATPRVVLACGGLRRELERLVEGLDPRGQEILVACCVDGMTQEEIAASLGISRRAVVKRLAALREQAGRIFEGEVA